MILAWGFIVVPSSAFTQIQWSDRVIIPESNYTSGGFYGGDGERDIPGEWIDWCLGNYLPGSGLISDDMIFSTNVGNFMVPGDWYERMRIKENGQIGIGTDSPYQALTMSGTIGFEDGTTPLLMNSENCCTYGNRMIWAHSPGYADWGIYYDDNDDQMRWRNLSADILTVDFISGRIGVNTTNPVAQLDVRAEGGYSAIYGYREDNGNLGIIGYDSDGVYGYSPINFGTGVTGVAAGSGACGVYGKTTNSQSYAGYFWTDVGNGVISEGHWYGFKGVADQGTGVSGEHSPTGNYGALGTAYWAGYFTGDVYISGSLTKGSGSFVQPHAKDPSREINYAFFEGPEHAVFLRGSAQLKDGKAVIELPEHFQIVAAEEGVQVQVTPVEDCNGMFVANKSRERIEVKELMSGKHNAKFDYFITAIRDGFQEHEPVTANTHFKPGDDESAKEFEKRFSRDDMTTRAMRSMLISNGILSEDGKLNMAKVSELGWIVAEDNSDAEGERLAELRKR